MEIIWGPLHLPNSFLLPLSIRILAVMASSIILHQDKICQGFLLSCLVQPQQKALLVTAIRMQLPPRAGSLACRRGSCRHRGGD